MSEPVREAVPIRALREQARILRSRATLPDDRTAAALEEAAYALLADRDRDAQLIAKLESVIKMANETSRRRGADRDRLVGGINLALQGIRTDTGKGYVEQVLRAALSDSKEEK